MTDNSPKKYTSSDYSILNEHFSQALAREKEIVRAKRSQTFWQNAKSISLILFFLGILAILIGKAIFFAKQERVVEVEKLVNQSHNIPPEESVITVNGQQVTVKKNVTQFFDVTVSLNGESYSVMTRHVFDDPRQNKPSSQSCYVTLKDDGQFSYEISKLNDQGQIIMKSFETQVKAANNMNFTESDVNYFQQFCRYV